MSSFAPISPLVVPPRPAPYDATCPVELLVADTHGVVPPDEPPDSPKRRIPVGRLIPSGDCRGLSPAESVPDGAVLESLTLVDNERKQRTATV